MISNMMLFVFPVCESVGVCYKKLIIEILTIFTNCASGIQRRQISFCAFDLLNGGAGSR